MEPHDPYAAPRAALEPPDEMRPMFGYGGLLLAVFFGSLVGGGLILALNFHAMARRGAMLAAIYIPIAAAVGMRFAGPLVAGLPAWWLGLGIWLAWSLAMVAAMWVWQGPALARRRAVGQRRRPWWLALGLGLALSVVVLVAQGVFTALRPLTVTLPG